MTKMLYGTELVGYIEERQARQVRALRQASHVFPRLAIIKSPSATPAIETYVRMKQRYGNDILIDVVIETATEADMPDVIARFNADESIHGIIVQLPLADPSLTDSIVDLIAPEKDVDGLGKNAHYESATAEAINWLLAGYGIDLSGKHIAILGKGRLVGAPLERMWQQSGFAVTVLDKSHTDIASVLKSSDIIVCATGVPRLVQSDMISIGTVVVDAGTASEDGVLVGDVDPAVRERDDITITPIKGWRRTSDIYGII